MTMLIINWINPQNLGTAGLVLVVVLVLLALVRKRGRKAENQPVQEAVKQTVQAQSEVGATEIHAADEEISENTSAAIAMALHLYYAEVHDVESAIITIKTVERRYSPWSSKIYGLNNLIR